MLTPHAVLECVGVDVWRYGGVYEKNAYPCTHTKSACLVMV